MFRGSHITRVDEKGRLKLPAEFKRQIDEEYGGQFYITSRDGKVAEIHPMREWEEFEKKLARFVGLRSATLVNWARVSSTSPSSHRSPVAHALKSRGLHHARTAPRETARRTDQIRLP